MRAAKLYGELDRADDGRRLLERANAESADAPQRATLVPPAGGSRARLGDWPAAVQRARLRAPRHARSRRSSPSSTSRSASCVDDRLREPELEALAPQAAARSRLRPREPRAREPRARAQRRRPTARAALDRLPRQLSPPTTPSARACSRAPPTARGDGEATLGLVLPLSGPYREDRRVDPARLRARVGHLRRAAVAAAPARARLRRRRRARGRRHARARRRRCRRDRRPGALERGGRGRAAAEAGARAAAQLRAPRRRGRTSASTCSASDSRPATRPARSCASAPSNAAASASRSCTRTTSTARASRTASGRRSRRAAARVVGDRELHARLGRLAERDQAAGRARAALARAAGAA